MHGDFDKVTFDPGAGFADVLIQQGRLLLPSDWNERGAIHNHLLRTLIVDLVGRRWRAGDGFTIDEKDGEVTIKKGHYYVDGILCDNDEDRTLDSQPFGPIPDKAPSLTTASDGSLVAFYLDCWERHVIAQLEPKLTEVALGGLDTTNSRADRMAGAPSRRCDRNDQDQQRFVRAEDADLNTSRAG